MLTSYILCTYIESLLAKHKHQKHAFNAEL